MVYFAAGTCLYRGGYIYFIKYIVVNLNPIYRIKLTTNVMLAQEIDKFLV